MAITFTDRAAREMREKIRRRCYQRLAAATGSDAAYWAALLRALDNARISTIHSFCAALLRSRAVEAGLDPQFAVLEQAQAETLLSEAVDDEMRRLVSAQDETTLGLAVEYGLDDLRDMVRRLVAAGTPDELRGGWPFRRWNWSTVGRDSLRPSGRGWGPSWPPRRRRRRSSRFCRITCLRTARCRSAASGCWRRCLRLAELPADDSLRELLEEVVDHARVQGGGGARAWPSAEIYATFRDAAEQLREEVRKLSVTASFEPRAAEPAAVLGLQLLQLADGVRRVYDRRKAELRVLDFNDLIVRARALLAHGAEGELARQLGSHITLLLVDEFQDTDPLQVELVKALCGEGLAAGKLFFVGDYKQSIYRFRGADPQVFSELRKRTPPDGRQSLSVNFRSQPAILEFVNALFRDELGEGYEPLHAVRASRPPAGCRVSLGASVATGGRPSTDDLRGAEAEWIARRIRALVDDGQPVVWDADAAAAGSPAARPARLGDIALLLRALTSVEKYEAALRKYEIDYYLVGGRAFYAQQEIFDLMNLLRALDSATDVVSLIGALRSPFFSLADETIFWLAQHPLGIAGGLFAERCHDAIAPEERQRVAFAARTIARLRQCKDRLRICELIELALELTGYDAILLNEFLGDRKLANLLKLEEQARGFQHGDFLGLADFIAQLSEFVVRQPDEPLAATHSEDTDVVRLMSVHQSKGLEFPIVFVPDMNRSPHNAPPRVHLDARLGPLARPPRTDDQPCAACGFDLWQYVEKAEEAAEMNRLLYVATTRTADYLVLSSGVDNAVEARSPWMQLLARKFDPASGRFIGHLPPGDRMPEVTVTDREPPRVNRRARTVRADQDRRTRRAIGDGRSARHGAPLCRAGRGRPAGCARSIRSRGCRAGCIASSSGSTRGRTAVRIRLIARIGIAGARRAGSAGFQASGGRGGSWSTVRRAAAAG